MKTSVFLFLFFFFSSCQQQETQSDAYSAGRQTQSYQPGFGEIMSNIQNHHIKLWFAGIYKNWKLADFEIHEIIEEIQNIRNYQRNRKETKRMNMLMPVLKNLATSVKNNNLDNFQNNFKLLTKACNDCHIATKYDFIRIKIPEKQTFNNQQFNLNP